MPLLLFILFLLFFCSPSSSGKPHAKANRRVQINTVDKHGHSVHFSSGTDAYGTVDKHFNKLLSHVENAKTSKTALKHLTAMEDLLSAARTRRLDFDVGMCQEMIQMARDSYEGLLEDERRDKWEKRSYRLMDTFEESFIFLLDWNYDTVESARASKRHCLSAFNKLHALAEECSETASVMESIRLLLRKRQMPETGSFEQIIDRIIASMEDTYVEKMALCKRIRSLVKSKGPIKRSHLLTQRFPEEDPEKVKLCLKALLETGKLVQEKTGSGYIVSDPSAKAKHTAQKKNSPPPAPGAALRAFPDADSFIRELISKNIPFDDRRASGGCLWVESPVEHDAFLGATSIAGKKLSKTMSSPKHFNGRSCRWIK